MPVPAFEEIQRAPPLAEQAYRRLRRLLRTGAFAPGDRLSDQGLAQSLTVSRTPVREALSRLAADGLLETEGGGFRVVTPTPDDLKEIFEIRRLLEPTAARQVAETMTAALANALDDSLAEVRAAEAAGDFAAFVAANYAFRAHWVDAVPSRRLRDTILRFDDQAGLVRRATLVLAEARTEALGLLERLAPAFRRGDGAMVATLTDQFIDAAHRFYRHMVDASEAGRARGD